MTKVGLMNNLLRPSLDVNNVRGSGSEVTLVRVKIKLIRNLRHLIRIEIPQPFITNLSLT